MLEHQVDDGKLGGGEVSPREFMQQRMSVVSGGAHFYGDRETPRHSALQSLPVTNRPSLDSPSKLKDVHDK